MVHIGLASERPRANTAVVGTGGQIGVGDLDGTVALYDIRDPDQPKPGPTLTARGSVVDLAVTTDGTALAIADQAGTTVMRFGLEAADDGGFGFSERRATVSGGGGVAFSGDRTRLFTGTRFWDITDLTAAGGMDRSVSFSHQYSTAGDLLAAPAYSFGPVVLLRRTTPDGSVTPLGEIQFPGPDDGRKPLAVAVSPDRRLLVASTETGGRVWTLADPVRPRPAGELRVGKPLRSLAFTDRPGFLVAVDNGGEASIWEVADAASPRRVAALAPPPPPSPKPSDDGIDGWSTVDGPAGWGEIATAARAPRLVSVSADLKTVTVWDIRDPRKPRPAGTVTVQGSPTGFSMSVGALSPDGNALVAQMGGADRGLRLWDISNPSAPAPKGALTGYTQTVNRAAFSPRGNVVATVDAISQMRLWEVSDLAAPTALLSVTRGQAGHPPYLAVAFDGGGDSVYFGNEAMYSWNVADATRMSANPRAYACSIVGKGPSAAEWAATLPAVTWREVCR
ncbi:WD40 repeat domain-containing protein [Phytohabitans aurantiacus]|uniref:WD40 repeat domain-containing protein n=1 Tax=Phytohabitans aurantiacus TaxID=3016789 RepID=A0ABQ5RBR2_9ACTN|nr:WD40 repeat domain-containing protein [Phytohabitans aurantiacus]GLI03357.1 hypothetical protein Pa4123_86350 [Phytohabitans aurantiacus]